MSRRKHNLPDDGQRSSGFGRKVAATAGSFSALYLLPVVAQGAVITASNLPVSLTLGITQTVTWNIDGNGAAFALRGISNSTQTGPSTFRYRQSVIFSSGGLRGGGVIGPGLKRLAQSNYVGASAAGWGGQGGRVAMSKSSTNFGPVGSNKAGFGLIGGGNYIGFRFGTVGAYHYGWADLNLNLGTGLVTIKDGAYNDVIGERIHIADKGSSAPEPSSLALLAIGAGGLAAFRRRKQRNAAAAA